MNIDIWSDVVCPWCFIGKRQLDAALDEWRNAGEDEPVVTWRPFELNPQLPAEGIARDAYVAAKFGGRRSEDVYARVRAAGARHGIDFAFDRIERQPNTRLAHCLIAAAREADPPGPALQSAVKEALMRAFFLDGIDLTDVRNLADIAASAGLERALAERSLTDAAMHERIGEDERRARAMGIEGVPFFVFDDRLAVSGAQGTAALVEAMRQAEALAVE
jgi:predicted DsbA family dithiol-disulfide isomerase